MIYNDYYNYKIDSTIIRPYEINQAQTNGNTINKIWNSNKIIVYITKIHLNLHISLIYPFFSYNSALAVIYRSYHKFWSLFIRNV